MAKNHFFTSESVTSGHPDKLADCISDSILDALLAQDKHSRVACETMVTTGLAMIAGEITSQAQVSFPDIVRETIRDIGYTSSEMGFDWQTCAVMTSIDKQSPDIAQGVNESDGLYKEQGAGDQGLMFGFACDETPELMPSPILYAHKLTKQLADVRSEGGLKFLRPDGKSQVTIEYEDELPKRVDTIVISTQHSPDVSYEEIRESVIEKIIKPVIPEDFIDDETRYFINPTGKFVVGGPMGDCGLTGRKIIVDTYGGMGRHGGGCFSGKDPSKVDRSAAYMGRHVAKNIVAAGLASKCEVQVAYAIGVAEPVSVRVDFMGTGRIDEARAEEIVRKVFDLRPAAIIDYLNLKRPIYRPTAAYGHFGRPERDGLFTWEEVNKADEIRGKAGL
ncbi:MAG: methionine adenosyltransferase [Desulfosudaceae bacterium]